jgi:hypothetical protein
VRIRSLFVAALTLATCVSASPAAPASTPPPSSLGEPLLIEAPSAAPDTTAKSGDVRKIASFRYKNGTDIDFSGDFVYAAKQGNHGGVYVFDVSRRRPKRVAFIPCPGTQNDVAVVRPGLIALGFYSGSCGSRGRSGVRLIDVADPSSPRLLDSIGFDDGTHTLTVFPGKPLIYASSGGLSENGGTEYIIDVSDPKHMKVVEEYVPNSFGCHDVSFHVTRSRRLGFCPGQLETEIWDVSKARKPRLLASIPPIMEFPHSAVASPDGNLLVIGDESLFTAHDCVTGQSALGALYAYDITDPTNPTFQGRISSPRGAAQVGTLVTQPCTAHNFNFAGGTRKVVASWYTGGTSVIDFRTPSAPKEIAYYRPEDANTWSSYFYRGQVFASDGTRGLDVLESDLLPPRPPTPKPTPDEPDDTDKPKPCWVWDDAERSFVEKINRERERRGLRPVKIDPELSKVSQVHSNEMLSKHRLYHTPEKTLKKRVTNWQILGENVGVGGSVSSLHRAFMASPGHKANNLNRRYRNIGVGIVSSGGRLWVTVIFRG